MENEGAVEVYTWKRLLKCCVCFMCVVSIVEFVVYDRVPNPNT